MRERFFHALALAVPPGSAGLVATENPAFISLAMSKVPRAEGINLFARNLSWCRLRDARLHLGDERGSRMGRASFVLCGADPLS